MHRTRARSLRSGIAGLTLVVVAGLASHDAHAQGAPPYDGPPVARAIRRIGFAIGGALGVELFAPRLSFEIHAGELAYAPPPSLPPPSFAPPPPCCAPPPPQCCYAPPPPPFVVAATPALPPEPEPLRFGLLVNGLFQSSATSSSAGQSAIAGMAATLQMRTSRHSLVGLEVQSLTSEEQSTGQSTRTRRDEQAGLLVGRLFAWDAALAPYLELAGGLGHASIDTQALEVSASQIIGRAGVGIEMRLGPHLVLDAQVAQVHRFRVDDQSRTVAANDPTFIGEHEQSTEVRGGLGYRF